MKNLEIKAKYEDHRSAAAIAKRIKASYKGILKQTDTYFEVRSGMLKMRVINMKTYELIHYRRANTVRARYSNYEIMRLKNGQQLSRFLKNSLRISCVVVKERKLFIYENVRIHLDTVKRIGKFIEFEIVCRSKRDEKEAPSKMKLLKRIFRIDGKKILPYSYSDMIYIQAIK